MYGRSRHADFIEETLTGLEPYYGRPTPGNDVVDGYLADKSKSLDLISETIFDMNRALHLEEKAKFNVGQCVNAVYDALNSHFEKQGDWDENSAIRAAHNFKKLGFRSKDARAFVAFTRGMFFDDSDKAFQAIRCVGVSSSQYGSFTLAGATFEDSRTGNQFELMMPFTVRDKHPWRDSFDGNIRDIPCYALDAPDEKGVSQSVAKSYDIREMRVATAKFVAGGCLYRKGPQEYTSYRFDGFDGWYAVREYGA